MASVYLPRSRGKPGKRGEMTLGKKERRTHLEDVGDSRLRSEDQPRIGLDVGVFSRFLLRRVLPVCCAVAMTSGPKKRTATEMNS